jgi:hypothetical protein
MRRLCDAERRKREAIDDLIRLGAIRGRRMPGDLGEAIAAVYYDVPLEANANNPGYDLVAKDGRLVQVRTLRHSQPHHERHLMGPMRDPYDTLFAVKLDSETFEPLRAIEVPRYVLEQYFKPGEKVSWNKQLEDHPDVEVIPGDELLLPWKVLQH